MSAIVCYECGEKGHKANECLKKKNKSRTGAPRETAQNNRFYTTRNERNLTAEKQGFSFHNSQVQSTCKNIELLLIIDTGCTSQWMMKDAAIISDLELSKMGKVNYSNGTESSIETRGSVSFCQRTIKARNKSWNLTSCCTIPNTQET